MAGFPTLPILIFLLCQLPVLDASEELKELICALGGSVTFPLNFTIEPVDSIVWTFETVTLATIQPATENNPAKIIVTQSRNRDRMNFTSENYSLKLDKLMKNDSGAYRVEIHSSSSQNPFIQKYKLDVYEYLVEPKVTMALQSNKDGTCMTNLTCSMEQEGENVTYSWKAQGQMMNMSYNGSFLPISWSLEERDMSFICIASNPISSNFSRPIFARKLCEGVTGDTNFFIFFLCLLLVPITLVLLVPVLVHWRSQRKKEKEFMEKKRTNSHQKSPEFHPHSGENSEYATISSSDKKISEEDPENILYSTVQIPKKVENPHSLPGIPDVARQVSFENVI